MPRMAKRSSPSFVGDDSGDTRAHSRDSNSPELCISLSLSLTEGAGKTGRWLRPQHRVQWVVKCAHGFDRYSRDIPAFPAQWLYGLYVLSPVSGVVCHRRGVGLTTRLTPRSRRQDHTISPYAAAFRPAGMSPPDAAA